LDQPVLNWTWPNTSAAGQIDPYCEDQESKVISIALDRDISGPEAPLTDSTESAFWGIRWSAGNMTQFVEVDVQIGTLVTVVGNVVSIVASYPLVIGFTQPDLAVRATLGFDGGRPSAGLTSIPKRTVFVGTILAGGTSAVFPVPRFAVAAVMRNTVITIPTLVFNQHRTSAAANVINISPIGKLDTDSVPVANGARFFSIGNPGLAAVTDVSVVFYLGL